LAERTVFIPPWVHRLVVQREVCRNASRMLYGILRLRLGVCRDMSCLIARALWSTRLQSEWGFKIKLRAPSKRRLMRK
jgi:hypothetical protein